MELDISQLSAHPCAKRITAALEDYHTRTTACRLMAHFVAGQEHQITKELQKVLQEVPFDQ